jgi:hypothetical protein
MWCELIKAWGFCIGHWLYWTLTPLINVDHNLQYIALTLILTVCLQLLSSLGVLSLYESSSTGFQRRTFAFLGSRSIPSHGHNDSALSRTELPHFDVICLCTILTDLILYAETFLGKHVSYAILRISCRLASLAVANLKSG